MTTQNRNIVELARRVYALEQARLHSKLPTLNRSSIEGGAIQGLDDAGNLRTVFGEQFDGTHTATVIVGPPPPKPTVPAVTPALGGLRVYWDGTFEDGAVAPMDFSRVTVHAAPSSGFGGFDPVDQSFIVGAVSSATGGEITAALEPGVEYVVQLFAWSQAGKFSLGSSAALGTPEGVDTAELEAELAQAKADLEAEVVARNQALADAKAELEAADREIIGMVNGVEPADMTAINEAIEKNRQAVIQAQAEVDAAEQAIAAANAETTAARQAADAAQSAADASTVKAAAAHNAAVAAGADATKALSGAAKAQADATTAITSANGKNVVTYSLAAPGTAVGKAVGDTWFQKSAGGYIIGQWEWTGAAWAAKLIDSQVIANLDVGKLTAGTATINEAVAKRLAADFGTFKVLTADKLVVGSSTNLLPNGALEWGDARNWDARLAAGYQTTDVPPGLPAAITYSGGTVSPQAIGGDIPVTEGQELLLDFWLKADKAGSKIYIEMRDQTGAHLGVGNTPPHNWTEIDGTLNGGPYVLSGHEVPTTWTKYRRRVLMRPGVTRVRVASIYFNHPSGSVTDAAVTMAGFTLRTRSSAELIVDGAITANKITAGAITAEKLAALAVTAEKVAANAILAKHVKAGEINTDHLSAKAITSDKLAVGAVVAGTLAAGAINTANLFATGVITSDAISANAITADKINVDSLMAQKISSMMGQFVEVFAGKITSGMLQAEAINGMTMSGGHIYSPSAVAIPRVHIGNGAVEVWRTADAADPAITMGGAAADAFNITDPTTGETLGSLDSAGNVSAATLTVNQDANVAGYVNASDVQVDGQSLIPMIEQGSTGILAFQQLGTGAAGSGVRFGGGWLGYYELYFPSFPGRRQRVYYDGTMYASAAGHYYLQLVATSSAGYDAAPAYTAPRADGSNANILRVQTIYCPAPGYYPVRIEAYTASYGGRYRCLVAARTSSGGYGELFVSDGNRAYFVAEDVGMVLSTDDGGYNQGGGIPFGGGATATTTATAPPPPKKMTYTTTWRADWRGTYRGSALQASGEPLQQGTLSGVSRYSMVGFTGLSVSGEKGKTIAQCINGATVSKVEVYLTAVHSYYGSGGTALIGKSTATGLPSSPQTSGGTPVSSGSWKAGTGRWVPLPTSWASTLRSISLGEGGSSLTNYMKFSPDPTKLLYRITYTR